MAGKSFSRFAYTTGRVLAQWGLEEKAMGQRIEERWKETMGDFLAGLSFPTGFKRGILYVGVGSSTLLQELFYQKPKMLEKIQAAFGVKVRDIRLSLKMRRPADSGGSSKRRPLPPLDAETVANAETAVASVSDESIRKALQSVFLNSAARRRRSR